MSVHSDDGNEMLRRGPDDETADRLLTGEEIPGFEAVAAFVADARRVSAPVPQPSAALARLLDEGLTVTGAAGAVPAPPTRRTTRRMIEILAAKLAAAGLLAKTGIAAGALTVSATAAGATGHLPVVQDRVADAVATVGLDIPGGRSAAARDAIDSTEPGPDRGKAVSDAVKNSNADDRGADAADGKADAGKARATAGRANADGAGDADTEAEAPVETPNSGGTDTAGTASTGASDTGTDTAGDSTDADGAGSDNADAAPEETPAPESAPVPEDAPVPAPPAGRQP